MLRNLARVAFLIAIVCLQTKCAFAVSCSVVQHHAPSAADQALLAADYEKAAGLYKADLAGHPGDVELIAGVVHALLRQQKAQEAADFIQASLAAAPNSAPLISLRGEVEYRQGTPWTANQSAIESAKLDPCNARNHLLLADLFRLSSMYASSRKQIEAAHRLDPEDPDIRGEWIGTLSLKERIAEAEAYLASPNGKDEKELRRWRLSLANLEKMAAESRKACHLVSPAATTEIPFVKIMRDGTHVRGFGLDVALNSHRAHMLIDTGAGGILVSRTVAEHAGLKPFSEAEMNGVGDQGSKPGYTAYADSIHIGDLEFQDCQVSVLDSRSVIGDVDGLIGMNVFSQFMVTLDFPMRKLLLGPLPPRPGETAAAKPTLKTSDEERDESDASAETAKKPEPEKPDDKAAAPATAVPAAAAGTPAPVQQKPAHGPYDRYVAPEMKDYTAVYRVGHDLILPATLNGSKPKLFILDTGAWNTSISPEAAREVTKVHADDRLHVHGISGKVENVFLADEITFRFAQLSQRERSVVAFDTSRVSKNENLEISGFIGATTLELLTIHIDYRDGLVKFDYDPNRGYKN